MRTSLPVAAAVLVSIFGLVSGPTGCRSRDTVSIPAQPYDQCSDTARPSQIAKPIAEALASEKTASTGPVAVPKNILAISGGGQYAAYNAGLLVGWSESKTRPTFDVVTGISSGAIVAAYAFLGEKYDPNLQRFFTTVSDKDLFSYRPVVQLIRNGAIADPKKLIDLIERETGDQFFFDLKQAHAAGRRLFIGTMNVRTRRVTIWDVGAIACSQRAESREIVRKIFLAAGSIPGLLPSVKFEVEIGGVHYCEEHVDGGAASQTFIRLGPGAQQPALGATGWLKGSNLYSMAAGKLYAPQLEGKLGFLRRITSTISAALYALFRAELLGQYAFCATSGMKFHMIAIPEDAEAPKNSTTFDKVSMNKLFRLGYDSSRSGIRWRFTPPGAEPCEEESPRDHAASIRTVDDKR